MHAFIPCELHEAIRQNQMSNFEAMINQGCDLNQTDSLSNTPLMFAIQRKNNIAANLLLDHQGMTALAYAKSLGYSEIETLLK